MNKKSGLNKLYWGFLFIMFSFRIQGFDILPDIVGYLLFAMGFRELASSSTYFSIAAKYNIPMIILSIFSIYQSPVQGGDIHFGVIGILGIPMAIALIVLDLLVVYNMFLGIKNMMEKQERFDLVNGADEIWKQYKLLKIAVLFSFMLIFIPLVGVIYIIVLWVISIILAISIMRFLKICSEG